MKSKTQKIGLLELPCQVAWMFWNYNSIPITPDSPGSKEKPLSEFTAVEWTHFATYAKLKGLRMCGISSIIKIWTAMMAAGITPDFYCEYYPPRRLRRWVDEQSAQKPTPPKATVRYAPMSEYKILREENPGLLENEVNKHLGKGWHLHGAFVLSPYFFYQAVVKPAE